MNFALHKITQKMIHEPMPLDLRLSGEFGAYQSQFEVSAPARRARVSDVTGADVA